MSIKDNVTYKVQNITLHKLVPSDFPSTIFLWLWYTCLSLAILNQLFHLTISIYHYYKKFLTMTANQPHNMALILPCKELYYIFYILYDTLPFMFILLIIIELQCWYLFLVIVTQLIHLSPFIINHHHIYHYYLNQTYPTKYIPKSMMVTLGCKIHHMVNIYRLSSLILYCLQ